jgi:hypothetical protein
MAGMLIQALQILCWICTFFNFLNGVIDSVTRGGYWTMTTVLPVSEICFSDTLSTHPSHVRCRFTYMFLLSLEASSLSQ